MSERSPLMRVKNVSKTFTDGTEPSVILQNVTLDLFAEDFLCILGPSGCGKTTLMRCIAGFERYEGTIELNGQTLTKPSANRMMVFQDFNQLFHWKTVRQNVLFPPEHLKKGSKAEIAARADDALEKVNLSKYADFYPHQLSGGMKQRVAIAKALALRPQIILMDEPFASLDAMTRRRLQKELLRVKEEEKLTVLFVTHSIQEAITLSNRVMVMSAHGTIDIDEPNPLPKPVTPASDGYAELWAKYNRAIGFDNPAEQ